MPDKYRKYLVKDISHVVIAEFETEEEADRYIAEMYVRNTEGEDDEDQ